MASGSDDEQERDIDHVLSKLATLIQADLSICGEPKLYYLLPHVH